jgi:GxxExxY protein
MNQDPNTYSVIGAAMEVHKVLSHGFLESVYQEAHEEEFQAQNIPYKKEFDIPVRYKNKTLNQSFRADFLCYDNLIVELKAIKKITNIEEAQLLNYLKATGISKGLLLNFGAPSLEIKRYAN